ncbi:uncharacterized protein LOC121259377 [Juglans microcarpa x Juglans regia]|uniref:uncharacterized protein LOC121259377 n=1 Tax=Juglans microcarpa x Juglans regia TaxID=2249226 RepID=UPI001B7E3BC6|nr:uncharacterized protein LOC121259377 [Juglans microcarpa x Juglans regia]
MSRNSSSSSFPSCFCPSTTSDDHHSPPQPPPISGNPNLTTGLYQTHLGLFSLTWSRSLLGSHSLHLDLLHHHHHPFDSPPSLPSQYSFHLHVKPLIFWKKHGSKKLNSNTQIFWDLTKAKFGSGPEPYSGFYIAVVFDNKMTLLVGDYTKEAYSKTKAQKPKSSQVLVLKREHVFANKICATRARFGGRMREIQIDCGYNDDTRLCFSVDNKKVLQIKRLKWKFRGNERIEVDGVPVQISWDVYNWLFEKDNDDGRAVFMFRFEEEREEKEEANGMSLWGQQSWGYGLSRVEWRKMRKSLSSSSISMSSSAGSSGGSSVMEWASAEETELGGPTGFSLLVYAWKR